MEDLEGTCEELLFCGNLEPSSACSLLDAALTAKKKQKQIGKGVQRVIDRCVGFIGENPVDCLQASRCLSLPIDTLAEIISSDQVSSSLPTSLHVFRLFFLTIHTVAFDMNNPKN